MSYPVTFLQIKITNKKGREGGGWWSRKLLAVLDRPEASLSVLMEAQESGDSMGSEATQTWV